MAEAVVGGVHILRGLSQALDGEGYRVLLHDRRNCGASDVAFDDSGSEARGLGRRSASAHQPTLPIVVGGSSAGARLAIVFALPHPKAANPTTSPSASRRGRRTARS